jgi:hypothetical protein
MTTSHITFATKLESNLTTDLKTCKSVEVYKELCENFNVYEKIPDDTPIHPYFDFDYYHEDFTFEDVSTSQMVEMGKKYITNVYEYLYSITPEFCVLTSSSPKYTCYKTKQHKWKISFHLVIRNCLMLKSHNKSLVITLNKYAKEQKGELNFNDFILADKFFDESVYNPNGKLRAWNASKEGEHRPMILEEGEFEDSIVTNVLERELPIFKYETEEEPASKTNPLNSNQSYLQQNDYIQKYKDYVSIINKEEYFEPYDKWFKFQRASANIGIPFDVYDEFMRDCKGYNYDENKKYYEMPENTKNGRIGWGYIYEIAKESNPEIKNELDAKYGKPTFCKFKFMKIKVEEKEYEEKVKDFKAQIKHILDAVDDLKNKKISAREIEKKEKENSKIIKSIEEKIIEEYENVLYVKRKRYFEKFHFKLMSKVCYGRFKEDGFDFLTEDKLKSLYKYIEEFINRWIHDIHIREYEDVDFQPPPIPTKKDVFNLYVGLEYEKHLRSVVNMSAEEILKHSNIFIKHLWYLSGKNNKVLDYCLKYLAHIIQETGSLPRTSIVFKSEQGCGKNIFFENFAEKILGEQYLLATANLDHIIGRFPMISKKLLILMDETNGKESFLGSDKIKSFITAKNIPYEQKGIDPIMIRNCSRMIFFTNNDYPVKIEQSDRRFVVVECSPEIKNNTTYFKNLLVAFLDKKATTAFGLFLKQMDLSLFDTTNDRPITKLYKEVQTATTPSEIRYFVEKTFEPEYFKDSMSGSDMYAGYTYWCEMSKKKYKPIAKQTFLSRIKKYDFILNKKDSDGHQVYNLLKEKLDDFVSQEKQKDELDDDLEDEFPAIYSLN